MAVFEVNIEAKVTVLADRTSLACRSIMGSEEVEAKLSTLSPEVDLLCRVTDIATGALLLF